LFAAIVLMTLLFVYDIGWQLKDITALVLLGVAFTGLCAFAVHQGHDFDQSQDRQRAGVP
jgi:hypothetical protein